MSDDDGSVDRRETIDRAAISHDGIVYSVPRPGRHHDVCHVMNLQGLPAQAQRRQGLVTSSGRFVDRDEAVSIARAAGQILKKTPPDRLLFSEDMW